jgi:hypothetical protein
MSVFRVKLQNVDQGKLDINPVTSAAFTTSKQRTVYVMGPKKTNRKLADGDTFTDCNYWKRFAYPTASYENAFIEVVTDDGSVYSDVPSENTVGYGATFTLATTYSTTNTINFVTTYGQPAHFIQVTNNDGAIAITGELNGDTNMLFVLTAGESQVLNTGDLAVTQIRLKSASGTPTASVLAAVRSVSTS